MVGSLETIVCEEDRKWYYYYYYFFYVGKGVWHINNDVYGHPLITYTNFFISFYHIISSIVFIVSYVRWLFDIKNADETPPSFIWQH